MLREFDDTGSWQPLKCRRQTNVKASVRVISQCDSVKVMSVMAFIGLLQVP